MMFGLASGAGTLAGNRWHKQALALCHPSSLDNAAWGAVVLKSHVGKGWKSQAAVLSLLADLWCTCPGVASVQELQDHSKVIHSHLIGVSQSVDKPPVDRHP